MTIIIALLVGAAVSYAVTFLRVETAGKAENQRLNAELRRNPHNHKLSSSDVQGFSPGGGCHWDWVRTWWPPGGRNVLHCPSGGGGGTVH